MAVLQADLLLNLGEAEAQVEALGALIEAETSDVTLEVTVELDDTQVQGALDGLDGAQLELFASGDFSDVAGDLEALSEPVEIPVSAPGAEEASEEINSVADSVSGLEAAAAALGAGAIGAALGSVVGQFAEAERIGAVTGQILENVGASAGVTAEEVQTLALSVQEYTGFSDEAVTQAAGVIASFESISNASDGTSQNFDRTITASADLATAMGIGLPQAATTLGRALAAPENAAARLARAKIILTQAEKDAIDGFVAAGDAAAAQGVVLDAVERKYGGVAEAAGGTLSGGLDRASEAFGNFLEVAGAGIATVFSPLVAAVGGLLEAFTGLPEPLQRFVAGFTGVVLVIGTGVAAYAALTVAATAASNALAGSTVAALASNPVFLGAAAGLAVLGAAYFAITGSSGSAAQASEEYTQALRDQAEGSEAAVASAVALTVAEADIAGAADLAGVSLGDITNTILGQADVLPQLEAEYQRLVSAVDLAQDAANRGVEGAQAELTANLQRRDAIQEVIGFVEGETGALEESSQALAIEEEALASVGLQTRATAEEIEQFVSTVEGTLPGLEDAFSRAQEAGETAFEGLILAADPSVVGANLQQIAQEILVFGENLRVLAESEFADLAAGLAQLGPETAGPLLQSLADAIRSGNPDVVAAFAEQAAAIPGALEQIRPILEELGLELGTEGGASASTAFGDAIDFSGPAQTSAEDAAQFIIDTTGSITDAASTAGTGASDAIDAGFAISGALIQAQMSVNAAAISIGGIGMTQAAIATGTTSGAALGTSFARTAVPFVTLAMTSARFAIIGQGSALAGSARSVGTQVGVSLGQGIVSGLQSQLGAIIGEATRAVNAAEEAARNAADANSPSRLFAEVGADMGEGLVLGFDEAASALIGSAEAITRAAAGGGSVAAAGGGSVSGDINLGGIVVNGDATPEAARAVRDAAFAGTSDAIRVQQQRFDVGVS